MIVEALSRAMQAVFMANERNELLAAYFILQRLVGTAIGLLALAEGYGVVAVAGGYAAGAIVGLVVAAFLMARRLGFPRLRLDRARWPRLARASLPFAVHESFTLLLLKLDAVLLSLLSTQAAVGRYGAASRLYESTFFITFAITGAVAPMYVYLTRDSTPTVGAVFERSIKLALVALVPCAVAFAALSEPLLVLFFGESFRDAAPTLELLSASAVFMGVIGLCSTLISLRMNPVMMVRLTSAMVVLNVVFNLALQPKYGDRAAAGVMTGTLLVFTVMAVRTAAARRRRAPADARRRRAGGGRARDAALGDPDRAAGPRPGDRADGLRLRAAGRRAARRAGRPAVRLATCCAAACCAATAPPRRGSATPSRVCRTS